MASSIFGRKFERSNRAMFDLRASRDRATAFNEATDEFLGQERARRYYFERLFRVSIFNSYYNASGGACPDFDITPTPASAALMGSLGLLLKKEYNGFSISYNRKLRESLEDFLRRQAVPSDPCADRSPPQEPEYWTRLSFVLSLKNSKFFNFTRLPIRLNPTSFNFYFSNQQAHASEGKILLNPGKRVSAKNPHQKLLSVVPVQVPVTVDDEIDKVVVRDLSGEVAICQPVCVPRALAAEMNPNMITCRDVDRYHDTSPPDWICRDRVYLDFASVPEGKYTIEEIDDDPESSPPMASSGSPAEGFEVLYTSSYPMPLCFIDLLFTRPKQDESGIYPVTDLCPPPATKIDTIEYQLRFERRSTYWNYFIVPQPQDEVLEHLHIVQTGDGPWCKNAHPVEFAGPCRVMLANGQMAYRFTSMEPIPLQEQSTYCFQLKRRLSKSFPIHDVLVERLPVASIQQVLPETKAATCRDLLASLPPRALDSSVCRELVGELCPFCAGCSTDDCRERLESCLEDPEAATCGGLREALRSHRNYSNIYVYV